MFKVCFWYLFVTLTTSISGEVVITFEESGNDVLSTYSGTLNTDDDNINDISELSRFASKFNPSLGYYANPPGGWRTAAGSYVIDASNSNSPFYDGPREGSSGRGFGLGTGIAPTSISGQMTWENTTLENLGYDSSQDHVWTLRGTEDTITMIVVPEPATYGLILGFITLLFARYKKSEI